MKVGVSTKKVGVSSMKVGVSLVEGVHAYQSIAFVQMSASTLAPCGITCTAA